MINHSFSDYGFDKAENFSSLMPKVMDKVGEDMLVGNSDVVVPSFDDAPHGFEPLVVISTENISNEDVASDEDGAVEEDGDDEEDGDEEKVEE